jgi:hypothetical protein
VTIPSAVLTEIGRRVGSTTSGTFKITGPPTAAGAVRTLTATYSALGATTATITPVSANEVQTVNFNIASTGGSVVLKVPKADGTPILTTPISWNATDATYLSSINTALDAATGVSGGIVATAITAVDTDLGFVLTFSGTGYAGLPQPFRVTVETLPTSSTSANVVLTTAGVDGRFVTGSLIQPVDGSETPLTFIGEVDGGILVTDSNGTSLTVPFHRMPIAGTVDPAQLVNWPADASTRIWLRQALSTASGGKFVFGDVY